MSIAGLKNFFFLVPLKEAMNVDQFILLNHKEQLCCLNQFGKLRFAFELEEYQFTLYRVKDFYVELKRKVTDVCFERLETITADNLPSTYKSIYWVESFNINLQ